MYGRKNYSNRGGYGNRGGYPQKPQAKKSGATYSTIRNGNYKGEIIVNAWNKSRSKGLITAKVSPYKGSKKYTADSTGHEYVTMIAVVSYQNSGIERVIPCSMNVKTRVIALPEIGMVITPNGSGRTASGKNVRGYFGKFMR